jgi:hypothetical protein
MLIEAMLILALESMTLLVTDALTVVVKVLEFKEVTVFDTLYEFRVSESELKTLSLTMGPLFLVGI